MKITEIKFKNINNLKGEHVIQFDKSPLCDAGLFAITGPTGSGKSTILDVITLALFNRIPRFSGAITKENVKRSGSVLTHHTKDCYAQITYVVKGKKYTSKWEMRIARTGNLQDYDMTLYREDGTPMDLKKSEIPAQNEKIIGLEYDQFVKSIILSQGEFAKLIKAKKSERVKLLENITGTYIYRNISRKVYERYKEIKSQCELEEDRLQNIVLLPDEEVSRLNSQMQEIQKKKENAEEKYQKTNTSLTKKKELADAKNNLSECQKEKEIIETKKRRFAHSLQRLAMHEKVAPLISEVTIYQNTKKHSQKHKKAVEENRKNKEEAKKKLDAILSELQNLTRKEVSVVNFLDIMESFEKKINKWDSDLENLKIKGQEIRSHINRKSELYSQVLTPGINPKKAIEILEKDRMAMIDQLKTVNLKKDHSKEDIETRIQKLNNQINISEKIIELEKQIKHLKTKISDQNRQKEEAQKKIDQKQPLCKTKKKLLEKQEQLIESLRREREQQKLIASLETHRQTLVEGEPCPLCGSIDHPYAHHLPPANDRMDDQMKKLKEERDNISKSIIDLQKDIESSKGKIRILEANIVSSQKEVQDIKKKKENLEKQLPKDRAGVDEKLLDEWKVNLSSLKQALKNLHRLEDNEDLRRGYSDLDKTLIEYKNINDQRQSMYQGTDVSNECNDLQNRFIQCKSDIKKYAENEEKEAKSLNETIRNLDSHKKRLLPMLKKIGIDDIEKISNYIIEQSELNKIKQEEKDLEKSRMEVDIKIKELKEKIAKLRKNDDPGITIDYLESQLAEIAKKRDGYSSAIGEISQKLNRDKTDRNKAGAQKKKLEKLRKDYDIWALLNKMIGSATGDAYANFAQGITLKNLLAFANKRLTTLTDRYLLDMPSREDGAINVIDRYQGDTVRTVTTLSGGESFLVSLSLALSLSDMASNNVKLNSLFIDEGFGTLDKETLEIALDILEKLQSESEKTVGIISHVEALKERICTRIKLSKNAQGYGKVDVVHCT